jgi:hypothetical protein
MKVIRASLRVSTFAAVLAAISCSGEKSRSDQRHAAQVVDGVEVMCPRTGPGYVDGRDPDVVQKVIYTNPPPTCSTLEDCPGGSYCRAETNNIGVCDLKCDPTNKCTSGSYCSCNGVCISTNGPPPPTSATPTACPRDMGLLLDPATKQRACEFDDFCPYGSHCDKGSGKCDWTCSQNSDCTAMGETCDCRGVCVMTPGRPRPPSNEPRLAVTPTDFVFPHKAPVPLVPDWGSGNERTIDVDLRVPFLTKDSAGLDQGPQSTVIVTPDQNLKVKCQALAADGGMIGPPAAYSDPGKPCKFETWNYKKVGATDVIRARNRVTVSPVTPQPVPPETQAKAAASWTVRISGQDVHGAPILVNFRHALSGPVLDASTADWAETSTIDILGESTEVSFKGTLTLGTPAQTLFLPIAVEARVNYLGLIVRDPLRMISPNGLLKLGNYLVGDSNAPAPVQRWVDRDDNTDVLLYYDVIPRISSLRRRGDQGSIQASGTLELPSLRAAGQPVVSFKLDLAPAQLNLCTNQGAVCPSTLTCDNSGFCVDPTLIRKDYYVELGGGPTKPTDRPDPLAMIPWIYFTPEVGTAVDPSRVWCAGPDLKFDHGWDILREVEPPSALLSTGDFPCRFTFSVGMGQLKRAGALFGAGPIPLINRSDLESDPATKKAHPKLATSDLFARCWSELHRKPSATALDRGGGRSDSFDDYGNGLLDLDADCVSLGGVAKVLRHRQSFDSLLPAQKAAQARQVAMSHAITERLMSQWLALHSFVLRQGLEERSLQQVLAVTADSPFPQPSTDKDVPLASLIHEGEKALSLTLFADSLTSFAGASATPDPANPDYRAAVFSSSMPMEPPLYAFEWGPCADINGLPLTCPRAFRCETQAEAKKNRCLLDDGAGTCTFHQPYCVIDKDTNANFPGFSGALGNLAEQPNGIYPAAADMLVGHMNAVEADLSAAVNRGYAQNLGINSRETREALDRFGTAFRLAMMVEGFGQKGLSVAYNCPSPDSQGVCPTVRWFGRWRAGLEELHVGIQRAARQASRLGTGENPLGIPENDTPVFFGDVQGANSRYFASSDYLISGWADPAVKSAQNALDSARDAWKVARDSEVTTEQNKVTQQRRIDELATTAGKEVIAACGPIVQNGDAIAARDLLQSVEPEDINTCFIRRGNECPASLADEDLDKFREREISTAAVQAELCRLDYTRVRLAHNPKVTRQNKPVMLDRFPLTSQDKILSCFMKTGPGLFCSNPACGADCQRSCVKECGDCSLAGSQEFEFFGINRGLPGRICNYTGQEYCYYTAEQCQDALRDLASLYAGDWPGNSAHATGFNFQGCTAAGCGPSTNQNTVKFVNGATVDERQTQLANFFLRENWVTFKMFPASRASLDLPQILMVNSCLRRDFPKLSTQIPKEPGSASSAWLDATVLPVGPNQPRPQFALQPSGQGPTCQTDIGELYDPRLAAMRIQAREYWAEASVDCASRFKDAPLPQYELPKSCYQGRIGDSVQALLAARHSAAVAGGIYALKVGALETEVLACRNLVGLGVTAKAGLQAFIDEKAKWAQAAAVVGLIEATVGFALQGGGATKGGNPGAIGGFVAGTIFAQLGAEAQAALNQAEARFQLLMQDIANETLLIECRVKIDTHRRDLVAQAMAIKTQGDVVDAELLKMANAIAETKLTLSTASSAVEREELRPAGDYAHHMWVNEKVERFRKEFASAKQMAFLAMRAVEFEMQQSLPVRAKIVEAVHPGQLEDAVRALKQEQASRAINRRRPEEGSIVVSLRDDVLQVEDRSMAPMGERNWTPAMRLRDRLWDDRYSLRDRDGNWLGQGIPFNLKEGGALASRCGERLWRVTATVQGDGLSSLEPGTQLMLLKRNTFYSQFCEGKGLVEDGIKQKYQYNSIRPSNQLFTGDVRGKAEEVNDFTAALMYPWFNVRRFEFYDSQYRKGASEELAGRALYGDYVLLFPKPMLEKKFPLENVEDVLLRIDYLSVDNLPQPQSAERPEANKPTVTIDAAQ